MSDGFYIDQTDRLLNIDSSMGPDGLILTRFSGAEQVSAPFAFRLEVISPDDAVTPDQMLGTSITWSVRMPGGDRRPFNGVVSRLGDGGTASRGYRNYAIDVAPAFWLLTHTADCRIFQNQAVPDIVEVVLGDYQDLSFDLSGITGDHPVRDYCVQYRESDFAFVSRLLEDEGIFYFFKHDQGTHTMVIADDASAWFECLGGPINYGVGQDLEASVSSWRPRRRFRGGVWRQRDFNFETPTNTLEANVDTLLTPPPFKQYEYYDYPGGQSDAGSAQARTKLRMEAEEAAYEEVEGASNVVSMAVGGRFDMANYDYASDDGGGYAVTALSHHATDYSHIAGEGGGQSPDYDNGFVCIPDDAPYRPPRVTPRPVIMGLQTALVVGPGGEEIYCDQYGRIKVQFHWDRKGENNADSSCWIRVAQLWAGPQWGGQFIPRIGMEVLVSFLEGDPDRPLVVGCVYNATNMPPYTLPDNKTQSGVKSRSSLDGGADNYNEMRFEDKKGAEQVIFQAERDMHGLIKNDETRQVGHDQTLGVGNDQTITIDNNRTETVEQGNETVTIKQGNRKVTLNQGNDSLTLQQGDLRVTIQSGHIWFEAAESIQFQVGDSTITLDRTSIDVSSLSVSVNGEISASVSSVATSIDGDATVDISGGLINIG
jgi:type VI secretion system secreted protein VgrG